MTDNNIEARIQRLEDIEAIKRLKHQYAIYCDEAFDPVRLAPLFTKDAVWDGGPMGRYVGRETIAAFFGAASSAMIFGVHHMMNAVIDVDGDTATGQWHLWQPCTHAAGPIALWVAGRYDDRYVREDGVWRFSHLKITLTMMSPYEAGWSKVPFVEIPA